MTRTAAPPAPARSESAASGPTLTALRDSYALSLRAEGKSPATIDHTYLPALDRFDAFLASQGMPRRVGGIRREHVEAYIVHVQQQPGRNGLKSPATVSLAYRSLLPFWKWAVDEDEISESPMAKMKPPRVPEVHKDVLTDVQLERLLKVVSGKGFEERRDRAMLLLLLDAGLRRGELAGLTVEDVDQVRVTGEVRMRAATSKSRRERRVEVHPATAQAIDRYLRVRSEHALAYLPDLWLGSRNRGPLLGNGILQILRRRGRQAGVPGLYAHQFRHTMADLWLRSGGSESGLMKRAGWRDPAMVRRYGSQLAEDRANVESRLHSPVARFMRNGG